MKKFKLAAIIAVLSVIVYPIMECVADSERGYDSAVFGGEEIMLVIGLYCAVLIVIDGLRKSSKNKERDSRHSATTLSTESEQSDEQITLTQSQYTTN